MSTHIDLDSFTLKKGWQGFIGMNDLLDDSDPNSPKLHELKLLDDVQASGKRTLEVELRVYLRYMDGVATYLYRPDPKVPFFGHDIEVTQDGIVSESTIKAIVAALDALDIKIAMEHATHCLKDSYAYFSSQAPFRETVSIVVPIDIHGFANHTNRHPEQTWMLSREVRQDPAKDYDALTGEAFKAGII